MSPPDGRLDRLRGRLAKSQNTLGRSMLGLLGGGDLDEDSWEAVEDTLLSDGLTARLALVGARPLASGVVVLSYRMGEG